MKSVFIGLAAAIKPNFRNSLLV
jgi:ABC-type uncharacterized transport system permease subunit